MFFYGESSFNLQVAIEEDQYKAESKKLAAILADPEVEVSILLISVLHSSNVIPNPRVYISFKYTDFEQICSFCC